MGIPLERGTAHGGISEGLGTPRAVAFCIAHLFAGIVSDGAPFFLKA